MLTPRVSVCIVAYNHENYLSDCVMSVIAQARDISLEILIGDDHSNDKTESIGRDIEANYPELIRFFRHEENQGPARNYQFLIQHTRGEYIAHLDGDDFWLPRKLKHQVDILETNPNISAVYTNALCINDQGVTIGVFNNFQPAIFDLQYLLKKGNFLNNSSMMYRAKYKEILSEWREEFIDYKIHLYLASKGPLGYINRLGVGYRVSSTSSMIIHQGDSVRSMYWDALKYASTCTNDDALLSSATADFLRRILSRAIRSRSPYFFFKWARKIALEANQARLGILARLIINTVSIATLEIISHVCARINGSRVRVLYWR